MLPEAYLFSSFAEYNWQQMTAADEISMVRNAARGDAEAFRSLFEAHHAAVFRFAHGLTGSVHVAEDITQDSFLRFVSNPKGFDPVRGSVRAFLCGVARNLVRRWWTATAREIQWDENFEDNLPAELQDDVGPGSEICAAVQAAMGRLPILQREAIILFEFEAMSLEEVAAIVDADVGTIKSRLFRARRQLRRLLKPYVNQIKPNA